MTLHYRALPDLIGVDYAALPAPDLTGVLPVPLKNQLLALQPELVADASLTTLGTEYALIGKRLIDITLGSIALFLAAPVMIVLIALLWIESGNPFYTQERLGQQGRRFRMYKLRTMVPDAAFRLKQYLDSDPAMRAEWDRTQKLKNDPRITPLGRLLRKTSLDELPQIVNVIKGDMSLVGPRPMLPEQMAIYKAPAAYLGLRPGITGLWQVTARNEDSFALRATIDLSYAQRLSFWTDMKIMGATFRAVLRATGY